MTLVHTVDEPVNLTMAGDIAVVTIDAPPVNALSARVRDGLLRAFGEAGAGEARAIVLSCAGRTFVAGADISEFGAPLRGIPLPDLIDRMDAIGKPIVAALHGTALGGGLELALGAHYRVAAASARLGLPEVKLGLLPGAGGTQRLPRLVGVDKALEIITSGRQVPAQEALEIGLIDSIVPEDGLRDAAIAFAESIIAEGMPLVRIRDEDSRLIEARQSPGLFDAFRKANARKFGGFDAPDAIVSCVQAAVEAPSFEAGMAEEARLFQQLLDGPQAAAQLYYFFAEREAAKLPDVPASTTTRPIATVGVVGAGLMGGGIAMNFANIGIPVTIVEAASEALERGLGMIRSNYARSARRTGAGPEFVDARMSKITGTLEVADLAACDLVIEAVFERMDVKLDIFSRLDRICRPGAILASNTSALDLDQIAAATSRPQDVIGLHFFSPANVMRLLEVVRGALTADDVVATAMKLAGRIGKVAVLSGVCDGFIGNRMIFKRQDQAKDLLLDGALPWDVDRVLVAFGFPMGPFALEDLVGLDLGWTEAESKGETLRDLMCEAGRRGQKVGAGYYDYDEQRRATPSPATEKIIRAYVARAGRPTRRVSDQEILDRCTYVMINEGAKILDEGIAARASDIDVVWVNGYGWPVYRGGPMYYADQIGLDRVLTALRRLTEAGVAGFDPAPLLERLVAEGGRFTNAPTNARQSRGPDNA